MPILKRSSVWDANGVLVVQDNYTQAAYARAGSEDLVIEQGADWLRRIEWKDSGGRYYSIGGSLRDSESASPTYKWNLSGSGTNEYYLSLDPSGAPNVNPLRLEISSVVRSQGTLGSLTAGQWAFGDNDSLGYSTVYVVMPSAPWDPDDVAGYEDGVIAAYDCTVRMQCRTTKATATADILDLTEGSGISIISNQQCAFHLIQTDAETSALDFVNGFYDLEIDDGDQVYRLLEGRITLNKEVTR